jgi:hypothetical protein
LAFFWRRVRSNAALLNAIVDGQWPRRSRCQRPTMPSGSQEAMPREQTSGG